MNKISFFAFVLLVGATICFTLQKNKTGDLSHKNYRSKSYKNNTVLTYSFIIKARDWKTVSHTERFVDIAIPTITKNTIKKGLIVIYLNEGDNYIALPFNYYQIKHILSFQPSYKEGHAYISILGNFIINMCDCYKFLIIVVPPKEFAKNKGVNWKNYGEMKATFHISEEE